MERRGMRGPWTYSVGEGTVTRMVPGVLLVTVGPVMYEVSKRVSWYTVEISVWRYESLVKVIVENLCSSVSDS